MNRFRLFARHKGKHVPPRSPCGHRGSSGSLYCTQPDGHAGPHVDATEVGTISWPREERLAIEAPEPGPERPSWRKRLAARLADAVALLTGLGVLEEELSAAGLPGRCDWGDCDEPATGERWDDDDGWLPVCDYHASDGDDDEPDDDDYEPPPARQVVPAVPIGDGNEFVGLRGTVAAEPDGPWPPLAGERVSGSLSDDTDIFSLPRETARRHARNIWGPPRAESHWEQYTRAFGVPESLRYVAEILAAPLPQVRAIAAGVA